MRCHASLTLRVDVSIPTRSVSEEILYVKSLRAVILFVFPRAEKRGDPTGQFLGLLSAIIKRDAMISVAGQKKAGISSRPVLDPGDQLQMAQAILRNRPIPSNDGMENRLDRDSHDPLQFRAHGPEQALIIPTHHVRSIPASAHGP